MITRKEYMEHSGEPGFHNRYFGQFITKETTQAVLKHIGEKSLLESTDEHLNDIPLSRWDALVGYPGDNGAVAPRWNCRLPTNRKAIEAAGEWVTASTLVCIAKQAAREWLERERNK